MGRRNKRSKSDRLKGSHSKHFAGGKVSDRKVLREGGAGKIYLEPGTGAGSTGEGGHHVNSSQQQMEQEVALM